MPRIRWKKVRLKRRVLAASSAALLLLVGVVGQDIWTQRGWTAILLAGMGNAYQAIAARLWPHGIYLAVIGLVAVAFWYKLSELGRIYSRYQGLRQRPPWRYIRYEKQPRPRWENISRVRCLHIGYPGLLSHDQFKKPQGFGITIIRELLNTKQYEKGKEAVKIEPRDKESDWEDVLAQLDTGEFDLILTPMLETFERTSRADFTMPMFFSNIGLYVSSKEGTPLGKRAGGLNGETLDSAIMKLALRHDQQIQIYYVPGEISEKQGRKLYDRLAASAKGKVEFVSAGSSIIDMLELVESATDTIRLAFCESFHVQIGRNSEDRQYHLSNILHSHHILYPVCYAVRNGDYILRNRLNIGLLKMTAEGDGIVRRLSDILQVNKESLQAHFVSGWTDPRTTEIRA